MSNIFLGDISNLQFKVGSGDCTIYLGDTLLYSGGTPPTPTLQWVTFSNGDTIPSDLRIYGIKGIVDDLSMVFYMIDDDIYLELERNKYSVLIGGLYSRCYSEYGIVFNTSVEYTFSNVGCSDYYTVGSKTIANMSNDIQLLIYA